jgi:nicotinate phosphoribosyltransferase
VLKLSPGKVSWVGRKQVWRHYDHSGQLVRDVLGLASEAGEGDPLLQTVRRDGQPVGPRETLEAIRARCAAELARLPAAVRALRSPATIPVMPSAELEAAQAAARAALSRHAA